MAELPSQARVVIVGGGVIGCSIAYHLTRLGVADVVVVEQSGLTEGATWHAAGLVGQLRASRNVTRMLRRSVALYDVLEAETGQAVDWKQVGSLRLACSEARLMEIERAATMAKSFGLEMHIIGPKEARDLFPIMCIEGVAAAAYIPSDGHVDPAGLTQALAKGARNKGARVVVQTRVTGFAVNHRRVTQVSTDRGTVRCETVVNAAGMWARDVGSMAGVSVPACAVEHQYLVTEPIPDISGDMPTLRDPDLLVYYKPEARGLVMGGYESDTVGFGEGGIPAGFARQLLPENFARFEPLAKRAARRTPVINEVGIRQLINGAIPTSADGEFVMGPAPELDNYFVASGFLYGIAAAGGAGQMLAEWIVDGAPRLDLWPLDVRRFSPHHNTPAFLYPRAVEHYAKHYHLRRPHEENRTARGIRKSPLYGTLLRQGAVYGSKAGWERPNWFATDGMARQDQPSFGRANWFEPVGAEHRAVRQRVALIDQTSFAKLEVSGPGALAALQRLAAADLDRPPGSVNYAQLLNPRGGIECDRTITRLAEDQFYLVTGAAFGTHDAHWIRTHLPDDGSARLSDVTAAKAVINLCGPHAREVLEKVTGDEVSNAALPFAQAREIGIGAARALAIRIGYVGELGWELHLDPDCAAQVYPLLWAAGQEFGIANAGYRAIDSLRMEKGYVYWSRDITPDDNPFEAGLGFRVAFAKGDFLGRRALENVAAEGPKRRLCTFTVEAPANLFGGEPVMRGGRVLAVTTSANFGYTVGKPIMYAYLPVEELDHTGFEVEAFGEVYPAVRRARALYDPENKRLKA